MCPLLPWFLFPWLDAGSVSYRVPQIEYALEPSLILEPSPTPHTHSRHPTQLKILNFWIFWFLLSTKSQDHPLFFNHIHTHHTLSVSATMSEPIRNKKSDVFNAPWALTFICCLCSISSLTFLLSSTPQNTPSQNAPISSHARQPGVPSIGEGA